MNIILVYVCEPENFQIYSYVADCDCVCVCVNKVNEHLVNDLALGNALRW